MKNLLFSCVTLLFALSPLSAETHFELSFTQGNGATVTGIAGTTSIAPEVEATPATEGVDGDSRSVVIAENALEEFQSLVATNTQIDPSQGLRYPLPTALNSEQGELVLSFNPRYNGVYPEAKDGSYPHRLYYLFDSGHPDPNGTPNRIGGIQILLRHSKLESGDAYVLMLVAGLANGEKVSISRSIAALPDQWHTLRLTWSPNRISLYFNEHRLVDQAIAGPLSRFEEFFTLGGSWYGTWPLQGRLGRVQLRGGQ